MGQGNGKTARFQLTEDQFFEFEDCETEEDVRTFLVDYAQEGWNQAIDAAANCAVKIHPRWGPSATTEIMKLRG